MQAEHQEKMTGHKVTEIQAQHGLEHKKMQAHVAKAEASTKLTHAKTKLAAVQGANPKGVVKKATPSMKTVRTRSQPTNQHKTNPGPTRAKSSREEFVGLLSDQLLAEWSKIQDEGKGCEDWSNRSSQVVDRVLTDFEEQYPENPEDPTNDYTKQIREQIPLLKGMIAQTTDSEVLAVLIDAWDGDWAGEENEQSKVE